MNKFDDLKKVTDNFLNILHDLYGFYYDSQCGFKTNFIHFNNLKQNGHPKITVAQGKPDDPNPIILHDATIEQYILRNDPTNGSNINSLRGYIITMISEHWNEKIRKQIANVLNKNRSEINSDIMGDITKIRNDWLHRRGKSNNSASNKIIKFEKGIMISFKEETFDKIFKEIFKDINQLFEQEFGKKCYTNNSLKQNAITRHLSVKHKILKNQAYTKKK